VRAAAGGAIAAYARLLGATVRWRVLRGDVPDRVLAEGRPVICAFWHGRLLLMPSARPAGFPADVLVSGHADGRLIGVAARRLGIGTVTGSSRRGGLGALRGLLRALAAGRSVAITPDGPRGPRMRAGGAVIGLARLSGAAIVPVGVAVSRRWIAPSWDRFVVPLPFARGVRVWGEPLLVPRGANRRTTEALRAELEDRLNALSAEADRLAGRPAIEPAPRPRPRPA
jgi:lysophospholipid acyltransferase (LPLAT)-like uncharacterized protein